MITLGLWVLGRKTTEVNMPFSSYFISLSRNVYHLILTLIMANAMFVRFHTIKLLIFSLFPYTLFKVVTMCTAHLQYGTLCSTLLREEYINYLEFYLEICFFSHLLFIYVFSH